jgi:NAD(P)-dependent dehydrogenase (short-subunit alcohol dehydrogenase family)
MTGLGSDAPTRDAEDLLGLSGQCAVVTGANRGIGRAIALQLARLGAGVVVASKDARPAATRSQSRSRPPLVDGGFTLSG